MTEILFSSVQDKAARGKRKNSEKDNDILRRKMRVAKSLVLFVTSINPTPICWYDALSRCVLLQCYKYLIPSYGYIDNKKINAMK